jgi:predicted O-linked N-acetylglucosamine transferase (SPINDLY family)
MGVPTITLRGQTAVGRGGASILSNLGMTDWIADNPERYVSIARQMASDLPRLVELRSALRQRMLNSPLTDGKQFALDVQSAFRRVWRNWCSRRQ